jgi:adenosyl cobinamide kinase/adenosyl cobinamide phosphate guanylyltransferase
MRRGGHLYQPVERWGAVARRLALAEHLSQPVGQSQLVMLACLTRALEIR